jgi:CRISPR-associated protein Cas1
MNDNNVPIMMSKRAHMFYIEHARVIKQDDSVVFFTDHQKVYYNIPYKNTSLLLLGKGTSITDGAVRILSESNVVIGFCGSGGSPLVASSDITFLTSDINYQPTEYMQKWYKIWLDEEIKILVAKDLLYTRVELLNLCWAELKFLKQFSLSADEILIFKNNVNNCNSINELLLVEARFQKMLYAKFAVYYNVPRFTRIDKTIDIGNVVNVINSMLTHGNYIAYGCAAATLHTLGINAAFPILHGNTRRGGLVFDLADIIKSAIGLPLAFELGSKRKNGIEYRNQLIQLFLQKGVVDIMFDFVKTTVDKY